MVELQTESGAGGVSTPVYGFVEYADSEYPLVIGGSTPGGSYFQTSYDTGVTLKTGIYNRAAKLDCTVFADFEPPEGFEISISVQDELIFTGRIRTAKNGVGDRWRVTAYDGIADLKRSEYTAEYDQRRVDGIVDDAVRFADLEPYVDVEAERASPNFEDTPTDTILERASKWENAVWKVTNQNRVLFTDRIAEYVFEYDLRHIKEASAGKRTPPYQRVRVEGSTPVSEKGRSARNLIASEPVVATAGEGEPVYNYRDSDIETLQMARNVADKIYERLQRQQKGGWVEIVGRPEIRPFDSVVMPQTFGGEKYLVTEVKHTITAQDGFVTRLTLGGLVS